VLAWVFRAADDGGHRRDLQPRAGQAFEVVVAVRAGMIWTSLVDHVSGCRWRRGGRDAGSVIAASHTAQSMHDQHGE
jgi:hypothetical protein